MSEGVRILAWYRADPLPRMRRALIEGPLTLTLGGIVVALSFSTRHPPGLRAVAAVAGFALVAGAATFTAASMHRILRDDVYLVIRTDGVALQSGSVETLVAWDVLTGAWWDDVHARLVLDRLGDDPLVVERRFATIDGRELAGRIELARRRVSMGLPM